MSRRQVPLKLSPSGRRLRYTGRKAAYVLMLAVLAGALALADRAGWLGAAPTPDQQKYDKQSFVVVHAVDGDTIDIKVPDGKYPHTRLRLWGVDTPETKDKDKPVGFFGHEAAAFTKAQTLHKTVRIELEPDKDSRDKYKRLLAWVYLPDGRLLNRVLIEQGYGYADPRFKHQFSTDFARLQAAAMNAKRGLWSSGPPKDMPYYYAEGKHKLPMK